MSHLKKSSIFVKIKERMKNTLYISLVLLVFASCKVLTPTTMFETEKDFEYMPFEHSITSTILQPYDQISVLMYTNNGSALIEGGGIQGVGAGAESPITYMIRQDSTVKLPIIGDIRLGGMEKDSAEYFLEQKLGQFYQNPYIKITITNRTIILFFEKGTQGQSIAIPEDGITLLDAIAGAGGLTENSKAYKIKLIRGDNKNPRIYNFNISNIEEFRKANFVLEANDIIYVDSRPRYMTKILSEVQPYLMLVTTISSTILAFTLLNK